MVGYKVAAGRICGACFFVVIGQNVEMENPGEAGAGDELMKGHNDEV
jgi:hypothetical protein